MLKVGLLVCFDIEFPEPARCLALAGATVLIVPTALGGCGTENVVPACCIPTRAMENHVAVLYVIPRTCAIGGESHVCFFQKWRMLPLPHGPQDYLVRSEA